MTDLQSKRTIHTQMPELDCGSVLSLPVYDSRQPVHYVCVVRKVTNAPAWKVVRVDVAKSRALPNSEMELSARYLIAAKLAYSPSDWHARCTHARLEEHQRANITGVLNV